MPISTGTPKAIVNGFRTNLGSIMDNGQENPGQQTCKLSMTNLSSGIEIFSQLG